MHLRSLTLKGFKSFPERTRLEFTEGVSVVVGPNGSGKSNITDAVLWALGEQSPLAVRGRTMQDVIFAGGHGIASRTAAEVEVVIDNSDGTVDAPLSEISVVRRLERSGEGEYRLNGARCRLVDVLEVLSDTGLGKEMHSVVSQGRVETIVHSRPRERRLMIEEAAGLGKHRKRRHRAQLKLARTQANLARASDIEREARQRLRPLKRQAEAADLTRRLARQQLEAELRLADEHGRTTREAATAADGVAAAAIARRAEAERRGSVVAERRARAEAALRAQARARETMVAEEFATRSAADRLDMRLERARDVTQGAVDGLARRRGELEQMAIRAEAGPPDPAVLERVAALEAGLHDVHLELEREAARELATLRAEHERAVAVGAGTAAALAQRRRELAGAEAAAEIARSERREAERAVESARARAAEHGAELAEINGYLRRAGASTPGAPTLAEGLRVTPGYETAVAAVLGSLLGAAVVATLAEGERVLKSARGDASALVAPVEVLDESARAGGADASGSAASGAAHGAGATAVPAPAGLERLERKVEASDAAADGTVRRLLADAWVVDGLDALPVGFRGVAVTREGRVWTPATGELRRSDRGGEERPLELVNRRTAVIAASESAAGAEAAARRAVESAAWAVEQRDRERDAAEGSVRAARREHEEAEEAVRALERRIEQLPSARRDGAPAMKRAQLEAELRADRRSLELAEREQRERAARQSRLERRIEHEEQVAQVGERVVRAMLLAADAAAARRVELAQRVAAGGDLADSTAAEVRAHVVEEAELQRALRRSEEEVTDARVARERARDAAAAARRRIEEIARALDVEPGAEPEPLEPERRRELDALVERLGRRRAALGPVNPLAQEEYSEALERVEELEGQRIDLESALADLQKLILDTDREIRTAFEQTFNAAARNFEELIEHLFPGGRGRLVLSRPEGSLRLAGGEELMGQDGAAEPGEPGNEEFGDGPAEPSEASVGAPADPLAGEPGVEVEVTPAGKSMKRLSLLSGGEKSLVALAFMFSVFLARPCPFYILDEVEAALDDLNIDRFLQLLRRYSDRAQFIVVTHQKRTMDVADCLYGVSMAGDGASRVVSRRLPAAADSFGGSAAA